jgi:hypothetical protein
MKANNHHDASVFMIAFLISTFLLVSTAFAVDISVTPQSGSIAVISGGLPQKITLLFSNYALNESLNLTISFPGDLQIINSTSYHNIVSSSLDVFVYSTSQNYGSKTITFAFSNNVTINYDVSLIPAASPPIIVEAKPDGMQINSIVTINVLTNEVATCKFDTSDKAYSQMNYIFGQYGTLHLETWQLEDGDYTYFVRCTDNDSNVMQTSKLIKFSIDTHGPKIVYTSPKFTVTTTTVDILVRTDEDATCRYAASYNNYDHMSNFDVSDKKDHYKTLTNLVAGNYDYFVQCKDSYGNIGDVTEISFSVDEPPKAAIQLSTPSPLKAGTIGVTVVSSKELKSIPTLTYTLDGSSEIKVPLTGSGNLYTGFMIIDDANANQVGEFKIQMTNIGGVVGTQITSGNTFMVQTKILPKIKYLTATNNDDGTIDLKWYLDQDQSNAKNYNIYRSKSQDVTQLDFYKQVDSTEYIDTNVELQITYYYRVAGVDGAGNVGLLSETKSQVSRDISKKGLTNDQAEKVSGLVTSFENTKSDLSGVSYDIKLDYFKNFKSALNAFVTNINSKLDELNNLNNEVLTDSNLNDMLDSYTVDLANEKKNIVSKIDTETLSPVAIYASLDDVSSLSNEYLTSARMDSISTKEVTAYIEQNQKLTDDLISSVTLTNYNVETFGQDKTKYSILSFDIASKNENTADLLIEFPKSIAGDINDINFGALRYSTIVRDPLISIDFSGKKEYSFDVLISGEVTTNQVKEIKTAFVQKSRVLSDAIASNNNQGVSQITGNMIKETMDFARNNIYVTMGTIIIIGLVLYLFFTGNKRGPLAIDVSSNKNISQGTLSSQKVKETQAMIAELKDMMNK